jgi:NodT family efflux transporter outer membrane factor (OMF) lipoprotein
MALAPGCSLGRWAKNGFKVGPNYSEPPAPAASRWIDYEDPRVKGEEDDLSRWWRVFNDPVLDSLIDAAYAQNLTVKAAVERIAGARARRRIAIGLLFPQTQQGFGGYSTNRLSENTANLPVDERFENWDLGGGFAWELDFWGRYRRSIEAAEAEVEASIAEYDDVLVILFAEVATNYILYRTFQERLLYARENVEIQASSHQLALDKFQAGATTERDVQQARQVLEQTRARIPQLETGLRQANNALCALQGIPPSDLAPRLEGAGTVPVVSPEVAAGIPADLVRRRPDVRRAERQVAAQSAFIGVAEADFYPRFSLLGNLGVEAEDLSDLFDSDSITGSFGPAFRWDLFNYGRILNNVRAQEAGFRELALLYQEAVIQAGRETEDALVTFLKAHERAGYLAESVRAADRTVEITLDQYREGVIDFTPVFLFQGTLTEEEDQWAISRSEIALGLVRLYRALGGGWEWRLAEEAGPETAASGAPPDGATGGPGPEGAAPGGAAPSEAEETR